MGNLEIFATSERHDLDEQARAAFLPTWPQFIFHDPADAEYLDRAETYFPHYDVLLLEDGAVAASGWGVPVRWDGTPGGLPDGGYDGALMSAVTGHEKSVPADTLCIMAAAVKAGSQGTGLAGNVLSALRARAAAAGLQHVIAPVRPALKSRYPLTDGEFRPLDPRRRPAHRPMDPRPPAPRGHHPGRRPALNDHHGHRRRMGTVDRHGIPRKRPVRSSRRARPRGHQPRERPRDIRRDKPMDAPPLAGRGQCRCRRSRRPRPSRRIIGLDLPGRL